jgi:hypothetical protein
MVIFNSYVSLPEGRCLYNLFFFGNTWWTLLGLHPIPEEFVGVFPHFGHRISAVRLLAPRVLRLDHSFRMRPSSQCLQCPADRCWTFLSSKWGTHRRRVVGLGRLGLEMISSFKWVQLTSSPLSPGWIREVSSPLADTTPPHDGNLAANHLWSVGLHGFTWCHFCEDEKQR